ncbi:MAG: tRNA 2-thiouridine(34) synthase MnmA [Syntrophaceae bacterium]|nr:tRNA 2-thiouridine(34) synthase MnmA [Syntrophaceae bacterium]
MKKKVLVAMSGGVDSSVAALLLKDAGYEIAGVTMCLGVRGMEGEHPRCCGPDAVQDAKRVCDRLGIRHYVWDYAEELETWVIEPFVAEYARGRTPNPCVVCNRYLKFGSLMNRAAAFGFDALATGHYANIEDQGGRWCLTRPRDRRKDQTYFLYHIAPETLPRILFPLGSYVKEEVRAIAVHAGLPVAAKAESQDVCFVPQKSYHEFLKKRLGDVNPGRIVDQDGCCLGTHKGVTYYTVGQRGGLGISHPVPLYVLKIDVENNEIVVGEKKDLLGRTLIAGDLNLFRLDWPEVVQAKIRYRKKESPCRVSFADGHARVVFEEAQEAITPGQSVVCYEGDELLGGGVIEEVVHGNR